MGPGTPERASVWFQGWSRALSSGRLRPGAACWFPDYFAIPGPGIGISHHTYHLDPGLPGAGDSLPLLPFADRFC